MDNEKVTKIYEVGYHIVPVLAEENVAAEVGTIKDAIESKGGLFISEEFPKLRPLAYAISKVVDGRKHDFNEAYFGWVKFEVATDAIESIQKALEGNKNVLRFLLIETVRENTMSFARPPRPEHGGDEAAEKAPITAEDEERISKSIDELVSE